MRRAFSYHKPKFAKKVGRKCRSDKLLHYGKIPAMLQAPISREEYR